MGKFWEAVGGKLADRWIAVVSPAVVFWFGGALMWALGHGGERAVTAIADELGRSPTVVAAALLLVALLGVAVSGMIVARLSEPVLRVLEGYWPSWLSWLRRLLVSRIQARAAADEQEWQRLAHDALERPGSCTSEHLATFARLDSRRRRRPAAPNLYLPTRIGNILRAAEMRPGQRYGLDAVAVWPRLWLVLPDVTRQELVAARTSLDQSVSAVVWCVAFCAFSGWSLLALPVGLIGAILVVTVWLPPRAEVFADLLESTFDLHRTALYRQLRWPLPLNPSQEPSEGRRLTRYLWRGSDDPVPGFTTP